MIKDDKKLIVLCATQRCGSTMIVDDFRSTGILGNPEEYFIPWTSNEIADPIKNIERILELSSTDNNISVIKVMADQLPHIERNLARVNFHQSDINDRELFPNCKKLFEGAYFIRIERLDIISQAISRFMAAETGKNHLISKEAEYTPGNATISNIDYNESIGMNVNKINNYVISIAKEKNVWDRVLSSWGGEVDHLIYEECIDDRSYLHDVCERMNVTSKELRDRQIKKIGNDKNKKMIIDYVESSHNLTDVDGFINGVRDIAFSLIGENDENALSLLKLVYRSRPNSPLVIKRIKELSSDSNE